jgi:hypothetical protein
MLHHSLRYEAAPAILLTLITCSSVRVRVCVRARVCVCVRARVNCCVAPSSV